MKRKIIGLMVIIIFIARKPIIVNNSQNINIINKKIVKEKRKIPHTNIVSRGDDTIYIPIKAIVTAYAPYDNKSGICHDGSPNTTATNTKPKHGTLAADPSRLPYGTKIYIPNYGYGVVEDTGGALRKDKNNIRIDVFMESYDKAIQWGRQELIVYIIK